MITPIDLPDLLALYGTDLARAFARLPQATADRVIEEFAAGLKEGADIMRAESATVS